jgi:hypothetical protein
MNIGTGLDSSVRLRKIAERDIRHWRALQQMPETRYSPTFAFAVGETVYLKYHGEDQIESRAIARHLREVLGITRMEREIDSTTGEVSFHGRTEICDFVLDIKVSGVGVAVGCELVEKTRYVAARSETYFEMDCGVEKDSIANLS